MPRLPGDHDLLYVPQAVAPSTITAMMTVHDFSIVDGLLPMCWDLGNGDRLGFRVQGLVEKGRGMMSARTKLTQ